MKQTYVNLVVAFIVIGGVLSGSAVAGTIYWAERRGDRIGRADLDGANQERSLIPGRSGPTGIDVWEPGGKVYWTEVRLSPGIYRANLDGTDVEPVITANMHNPNGIALNGDGRMYWTHDFLGSIESANPDGTDRVTLVPGLADPYGIALDCLAGKVYWTDSATGKVQRAPLDGGPVEDLFVGLS